MLDSCGICPTASILPAVFLRLRIPGQTSILEDRCRKQVDDFRHWATLFPDSNPHEAGGGTETEQSTETIPDREWQF